MLFSSLLVVSSCAPPAPSNSPKNQLTIGNPEGVVEGTELGIRQLATMLSVEGLTQLGDDGRPVPRLAESWWWDKNGLQLNVNLRSGITFHDGTPLTADIAASILGEAIGRQSNRAMFTSLRDVIAVRAVSERQLVFDLSQPSALLPEDLELPLARGTPAVGTGPYRIVSQDETGVVLERFPNYYFGVPHIQRVVIKPFDTLRTAWTSLLRGEVDMVTDVPPDAVEFIRNDDVRVTSFGRRYQYLVAFNSTKPPFNQPIVRRALNAAIDREALIQKVLQGHGLASTGPLWPKHWAYNASITAYRFDPGLAVSLMNSAGILADKGSGGPQARFKFTCLVPENFSVTERVALEVQRQLYNVGVDMQFEVVPIEQFGIRVQQGQFEAILIDMISGPTVGRSYLFWRSATGLEGGLNTFGYENAEAERLFTQLRQSTNEIAIRSAFTRFQEVMLDDPPALFLAWNERSRAVRRDFDIVQDPRDPADPVYSIWRWTAAPTHPRLALAR